MTRRFLIVTVCLTATIGVLVGLILAGTLTPARADSAPAPVLRPAPAPLPVRTIPAATADAASFADVAERLNPAVVNIDATVRSAVRPRRRAGAPLPDSPDLFDGPERDRDGPRRGAGTGFLVDPDGYILTNEHVIDGADRIMVRLTDGRSLRAERIGADSATDIALIKVQSPEPLPFAPLGDSDTLRVGEWVVAIGNPLAYEHTVTVGVVSFIGRKLFNQAFDRYIQTDAAINFGNSGGPLINARGEVIGINAAISSRAANIGFAVPINQASAILPQLREHGRVSRGYIGVVLRDVDADLQRSLRLSTARGAIVEDVTPASPGARAGIRIYDLLTAVDGHAVASSDELIHIIAARQPGTTATLRLVRDGRAMTLAVKLAERPQREGRRPPSDDLEQPRKTMQRGPALGMSVRDLDGVFVNRFNIPDDVRGVVITRVDPMSPAFDADVERDHVLLEINRQPVRSLEDYRRIAAAASPGEVLTLYLFKPESGRRALHTLTVDER